MANEFDPYREALVMEMTTVWPDAFDEWEQNRRLDAEARLHQAPQEAAELEYVRVHTGFCRKITVTESDLARLGLG